MKLRLIGLCLGLFLVSTITAHSAQFVYQYSDVISFTDFGSLSVGDNAVITITLDNGGSTNQNQTWTSFDAAIINFNFGDGALETTFFSPFDGGIDIGIGDFTTDATGNLVTVLLDWTDFAVLDDYSTNGGNPSLIDWYLNGKNGVYYQNGNSADGEVQLENVADMLIPGNWTEVTAPVPVPAAAWLFGSALLGLVGYSRRKSKA